MKVAISKIKGNENNPRTLKTDKFKKLVNSIKEFPKMLEIRPIIVDENMMVLGGNMRLKACQKVGLKEVHINKFTKKMADEMNVKAKEELRNEKTYEEYCEEFIIKDNVGFGEWDWSILANQWDSVKLDDWGLDSWQNLDDIETEENFSLPDGDKLPFQQLTLKVADEQADQINSAISEIKLTEEYKYVETFGNENSNGNALYLIIMQWVEQKK